MKNYSIFLVWIIAVAAIFQSCTKTEYLEYEQEALTRINEYRVTNAQQELLGAIDHQNNTVTVYVPYYLGIDHLVSEIKIDKGAKLLDSLGNEINLDGGLEPVKLGAVVKYTVQSITGTKRTYTLIQKILPHSDELSVTVSGYTQTTETITKPVYGRLTLLGNFESTSMNAKFYLTDRNTGEVHTDYINVYSVTPASVYTMIVDISPDAKAGEYDVKMEHQGRTTKLPGLKLFYQKPWVSMFTSSSRYAPGDTIKFEVNRLAPNNDTYATVFVGLKEVYMKIGANVNNANLPGTTTFPANLINTKIPMKLVSYNGKVAVAIFPDIPAGIYIGAHTSYGSSPYGGMYYAAPAYGITFYGNFDEQTDWGDDLFIASQIYSTGGFTVL